MSNTPDTHIGDEAAVPPVVDRGTFQAEIDKLRVQEKAYTRAGDGIAATRRRLPMVEVDATTTLIGADGPITLLDAFDGRRQLIAYFFMYYPGRPAEEQCEGCTLYSSQVRELSYLHSRDVTYATLCYGPYEESIRYRDFMGWDWPWYSLKDPDSDSDSDPDSDSDSDSDPDSDPDSDSDSGSAERLLAGRPFNRFMLVCYLREGDRVFETYWTTGRGVEVMAPGYAGLLDLTVYGRQETWEDSPDGWPRRWGRDTAEPNPYRVHGRPIAQWSRLAAGRSDDLGVG